MESEVCSKCGGSLSIGQAFCPSCGEKLATMPARSAAEVKTQTAAGKKKKGKKKIVIPIVVLLLLVIVLISVIVNLQSEPKFKKVYGDIGSTYCTLSSDGLSLSIDTNPSDIDNYSSAAAYQAVKTANADLGLPDSLLSEMTETRAIDGRQTETYGKITVSWTYHPDQGLEIIYKRS
jgi:hypothetical protein